MRNHLNYLGGATSSDKGPHTEQKIRKGVFSCHVRMEAEIEGCTTSRGMPGTTRSWTRQEQNPLGDLEREHNPANTLIAGFCLPGLPQNKFLLF